MKKSGRCELFREPAPAGSRTPTRPHYASVCSAAQLAAFDTSRERSFKQCSPSTYGPHPFGKCGTRASAQVAGQARVPFLLSEYHRPDEERMERKSNCGCLGAQASAARRTPVDEKSSKMRARWASHPLLATQGGGENEEAKCNAEPTCKSSDVQ
jgi:hypothetical protein